MNDHLAVRLNASGLIKVMQPDRNRGRCSRGMVETVCLWLMVRLTESYLLVSWLYDLLGL